MSDSPSSSTSQSSAGLLGLVLSAITVIALLVGLGVFGLSLLCAMGPEKTYGLSKAAAAPPAPLVTSNVASDGVPAAKAPPAPANEAAPAAATSLAASEGVDMAAAQTHFATCAACHGPAGKALIPNMAPDMAGSDYLNGPTERLAMIVLNGIQFTPGKFIGPMIAWKAVLTDEQIAGALTHARMNFGNTGGPVTPAMIAKARAKYADRNTPFTREELLAVTAELTE